MSSPILLSLQLSHNVLTALKLLAVIVGIIVAVSLLITMLVVPYMIYRALLVRTKKKKWNRECSSEDPEILSMYAVGESWRQKHSQFMRDVTIVNEGFTLWGEYTDLGNKKAVIIVPGRSEGLIYSYYFASPYAESGYNVLCIDQRAHGKSDGKYNSVGFKEHRDLMEWARMLREQLGMQEIVLHGICIGASCCMFASTAEKGEELFDRIVVEGMYPCFYESLKNHAIRFRQPLFPTMPLLTLFMKLHTGADIRIGPQNVIGQLNKPLLMIHSKEDTYSLPHTAQELYEKCASPEKRIVWFEKGEHSHLRITDTEKYDGAICAFLREAVHTDLTAAR